MYPKLAAQKTASQTVPRFGDPSWGQADVSIYRLLQSTRWAWTDAPARRARAGNRIGGTSLRFPVDKTPEVGYMGWEQLTLATLTTVRKDRKIKGGNYPLTAGMSSGILFPESR